MGLMTGNVERCVAFLGRALVAASALMVLFLAYQFWGTGLVTAREQRALKAGFEQRLAAAEANAGRLPADGGSVATASPTPNAVVAPGEAVVPGEAVALLEIPAIGASHAVVEGVEVRDLREGPGHYPWTPLPGERGNAAIAGHRTTYGAPFGRLDEVEPGDEIHVTTLWGRFTYRVTDRSIVGPRRVDVLRSGDDHRLTLTTCNPRYSAAQRLVVSALLVSDPAGAPVPGPVVDEGSASAVLDGAASSSWAAAAGSMPAPTAAVMLVTGAWWWGYRRRRRWYTWLAGVLPFLAALFYFYAALEQALPGSY